MIAYEIPLTPAPQRFSISLGGVRYQINLQWNRFSQAWVIDIYDSNKNLLIGGVPLVTGTDLFEQFGYIEIGGSLFAQTDNNTLAVPTFDNLGINSHLYFVTS
jgi:hypothetical protein